ncbi:MAG: oxygen-independent coproporphyrinogen III oxidase [Afipia sp.]|nr:oxygen-independent coproporphyrinogen III oxidase [Afipia sp.]
MQEPEAIDGKTTFDKFEKYARLSVPRYTSYPTAPHFQSDFPEATYRGWLGALDPDEPISLYLHIPFCREMCWYCGCNMKLARRPGPVADYVADLLTEIDLIADAMPARMKLAGIHFGGGTPTILSPEELEAIIARLKERYTFTTGMEAAIECDPRTLKDEIVKSIGALGFTRVSFGVQEFDPTVQSAINRIQPPEIVERAVNHCRAGGVRSVNFDLIYGLPHQTVVTLTRTIERCITMRPDRIALFGYAHVPWFAKNQRKIPDEALPGPAERAAMAAAASRMLIDAGYIAIGIDHFALSTDSLAVAARAGSLRRNFQGYTSETAETIIGIGATSIGKTPFGYAQNSPETGAWSRAIKAGHLPVARGHILTEDDKVRAAVIQALMCTGKADLDAIGNSHGAAQEWYADVRPSLKSMGHDGIVSVDGGKVSLTAEGALLTRIVASAFDGYLTAGQVKHSLAV